MLVAAQLLAEEVVLTEVVLPISPTWYGLLALGGLMAMLAVT